MEQGVRRPFAVLAALQEEAAAFLPLLEPMTSPRTHVPMWHGAIEGVPTVLALTGVGKVAAASAAQYLCDTLWPAYLLSIGLAGATTSHAARGQVIVASASLQHDVDARPLTSARGMIPGLGIAELESDRRLSAALAAAAMSAVAPRRDVVSGLVLTGDQIITSGEVRDRILAEHPLGACFDMETAAIAQVARQNDIPWAGLRITSDGADEDFDLDEVIGFGAGWAAETFARVTRGALKMLQAE